MSASSIRRASRLAFTVASAAVGGACGWYALKLSPILATTALAGMAVALWWLKRRETAQLGHPVAGLGGQEMALAVMLVGGVWLGVYSVFSLGDVGTAAGRQTQLPLGRDLAALTMSQVLAAGLAGTLAVGGLLVPFRRPPRRRRDLRETALVGRHGTPREVSLTPRTSEAVDRR